MSWSKSLNGLTFPKCFMFFISYRDFYFLRLFRLLDFQTFEEKVENDEGGRGRETKNIQRILN